MATKLRAAAWTVLLCGACALTGCGGDDEGMPDVVGQEREEAVALLEEYELTVAVEEQPSAEEAGVVLAQTPEAGAEFPEDDKVTITVASAPVSTDDVVAGDATAPDVVGLLLPRAEEVLRGAGVALGTITGEKSDVPEMTVVSQSPLPGEPVSTAGVNLTVSESSTVPVPSLIGRTEAEAVAEIEKVGLQVGSIETALEGRGAVGRVLEQSPDPGFPAPRNSPIRLVVKQDGVRVPNVIGQTLEAASPKLVQSGLSFQTGWVVDKRRPKGTIVRLDPGANQMVPRGSTVRVTFTTPRSFRDQVVKDRTLLQQADRLQRATDLMRRRFDQ